MNLFLKGHKMGKIVCKRAETRGRNFFQKGQSLVALVVTKTSA